MFKDVNAKCVLKVFFTILEALAEGKAFYFHVSAQRFRSKISKFRRFGNVRLVMFVFVFCNEA